MTHYGIILHETDLANESIIRNFRRHPLKVDKKYMDENGLCSCVNYTFPVIRELKLYEFDVIDSAEKDFEERLKKLGIGFVRKNKLSKLATFFWNLLRKKKNGRIELLKTILNGRMNSRSKVFLKKSDEEYKTAKNFQKCVKCEKNIPCDWL